MARIKIKKVPHGFEVKNGKLLKKASYGGGFVTGDQVNYGLVTTYDNNGESTAKQDVRYSLSSVPREFANIEAEGGETVLTDINNNGTFGLYDIKGPRHSQGGVPMYLPDQSFVFSDTPKMKMSKEDIASYGIETNKKLTPAKVSKKFPLNEYIAAKGDPYADFITERSAELMLDKNNLSLSRLAFGQEMAKGFEDGVPVAAYPFLQSQGVDPIGFAAEMDAKIAKSKAAYGYEVDMTKQPVLPKAQEGEEQEEKSEEDIINELIVVGTDALKTGDYAGAITAIKEKYPNIDQKIIDVVSDKMREIFIAKDGRVDLQSLFKDVRSAVTDLFPDFKFPDVIDPAAPGIPEMQKKNREKGSESEGLYGDVTASDLPQWFENNKVFMKEMYGYESYDDLVKDRGEKWWTNDFVKQLQKDKNTTLSAQWDKLIQDPEQKKRIDELGITKEEFIGKFGFDSEGKADSLGKGSDDLDGYFGEWTLNRSDFMGFPDEEEVIKGCMDPKSSNYNPKATEDDGSCKYEEDPVEVPKPPADPDFYLQDKVKMDALSKRDRDLLLPSRMAVQRRELDPSLMDPTRAIASINEQAAIASDAAGLFGPTTLSTNTARNTGLAFKQAADTIAKYDAANVGILNKADVMQARMDMITDKAERDNYADVYDGTQLAIQNYMDERNLDREQMADLYSNALTNRANTYNLNTMVPYFDIDPSTGGMVMNVDTAGLFKPTEPMSIEDRIDQIGKGLNYINANFGDLSQEDKSAMLKYFYGSPTAATNMSGQSRKADGYANMFAQGNPVFNNQSIPSGTTGKRGKQIRKKKIKKPAVPFYVGVTDGRRK